MRHVGMKIVVATHPEHHKVHVIAGRAAGHRVVVAVFALGVHPVQSVELVACLWRIRTVLARLRELGFEPVFVHHDYLNGRILELGVRDECLELSLGVRLLKNC